MRLYKFILCKLQIHSWIYNLPWKKDFAVAWKRCRFCGKETYRSLEAKKYIESLKCIPLEKD